MNGKSKVYVKTDTQNRIIRCDGGYTLSNIDNISGWNLIDEGTGDRYNLCQSHYFPLPLYTDEGIPRYKLVDGVPVERTAEEITADIAALPQPEEPEPVDDPRLIIDILTGEVE